MTASLDRSIPGERRPRLAAGVRLAYSQAHAGWILLAPERLFKADAVAVEILSRCTGEQSLSAIVTELSAKFAASPEQIRGDVAALLSRLVESRLVEID
jgi:pyrroloquinoline quinone biosynthesis protein D